MSVGIRPPGTAIGAAWWAVVSSAVAPVVLIGGWFVSGALQPRSYSPARQTISALAGHAATDRWMMTAALYIVAGCHLVTAAGLPGIRSAARGVLAVAGIAGFGVATFAQPENGSTSGHLAFATLGVLALGLWPATIGSRARSRPVVLSVPGAACASVVSLALLVWMVAATHGAPALGTAERVVTAAQTMWPFVVVLAVRSRAARMGA